MTRPLTLAWIMLSLAACSGGSGSESSQQLSDASPAPVEQAPPPESAPPPKSAPPPEGGPPPAPEPPPEEAPPESEPPPEEAPPEEPPPEELPPEEEEPPQPDDSGIDIYAALEGHGTQSTFGQGGDVCTVESVADSGAGTLRDCIENRRSGVPLEVRFRKAGTIVLDNHIRIDSPFLTIDGSSAPAPGITIQTGYRKALPVVAQTSLNAAHDVLISHLRIRGSWDRGAAPNIEGDYTLSVDCENNDTGDDSVDLNIVLNHLTLMNSPDGGPDIWGACRGITVRRALIHHNVHPMTVSAGSDSQLRARISLLQNLWWNNIERSPQIRGNVTDLDYVNNVVSDWRWYAVRIRANSAALAPRRIQLVGNAFIGSGANDTTALEFLNMPSTDGVYDSDNRYPGGEADRGTAAAPFSNLANATVYAASQLRDVLLGNAAEPDVGTIYPTVEEQNIIAQAHSAL